MRQAAQATGIDVTTAAAAAFNSKAIHDCDCRSRRQKGRSAQLPRNMKKDWHRLFSDRHTPSQEVMNGLQEVEEIEAAPSNDLDLPE
jgi:hypothetical protein